MCGVVDLVFAREPDYFALGLTQGESVQTLVASQGNRIMLLATRAIRKTKVNGVVVDSGYLADVRLHPEARGGYLLAKCHKLFRKLHADGRAAIYTSLVVEGNRMAMSTLLSGRANFPKCYDLGRIHTPLILVCRNRKKPDRLERGRIETLHEIVEFLNSNNQQFAPVYSADDFISDRFPGFSIEDFLIIRRQRHIVGVAGLWVQTSFRQTIALRYSGAKHLLRPLLNRVLGHGLPPPGEPFMIAYAAFVHTRRSEDYDRLINACLHEAKKRGITHLVTGMHERDERTQVLKSFRSIPFAGRMYVIKVEGQLDLDGRVPYMDPATL